MATLNQRLKHILPVVLAFLLPLLSILINDVPLNTKLFTEKWLFPFLVIYFLWHVILVLRHWKTKKSERRSIALVVGFVIYLILVLNYNYHAYQNSFKGILLIRILFSGLIIYIIQQVLWAQEKVTALRLEKEQLQNENLKIQLKELRNQMDPHFFFNSLTTLRSMVRQNHTNSEQFIIGLSDFYRQILKHQKNTLLTLSEELSVLKSYLFLMKNRNEEALHSDVEEINELYNDYQIPTLALQSVVENCFKHNIMSSKRPLEIIIRTTEDAFVEVINNLQPKLSPPETSGLGLELLKKRYKLLNVENGVNINSAKDTFAIKLKLIPPS
ncbi:MAG: histidine kinase [Bacteroidota bacterium]